MSATPLDDNPTLKKRWLKALTIPLKFIKVGKKKECVVVSSDNNKTCTTTSSSSSNNVIPNVNKVEKKRKRIDSVRIQTSRPWLKKHDGLISNNNTCSSSSTFLPEVILFEILSRVPVESLMRFKCLCKSWCYSIEQDRLFINLHRAQSEKKTRLFIVVHNPLLPIHFVDSTSEREFYLTADLDCQSKRASITTVCKTRSWIYDIITKPVKGLFCQSDSDVFSSVRIYNIGTHQVTPWIKSTLLAEEKEKKHKSYEANYQLGFDPATGEHKLVCLCHINGVEGFNLCEVLTVGDNVWRRINDVPPLEAEQETSVYVNGSIYWITQTADIMVFDVGSEKFRMITTPHFVVDELDDYDEHRPDLYTDLLQLGSRVAMLIRVSDRIVKLWAFGDYKDDDDMNTDWTEVMTITLPFRWGGRRHVHFHTIEGIDDQIIIRRYRRRSLMDAKTEENVSYYFYNLKTNVFKKFEIRGIPSSIPNRVFTRLFATFIETLSPVNPK